MKTNRLIQFWLPALAFFPGMNPLLSQVTDSGKQIAITESKSVYTLNGAVSYHCTDLPTSVRYMLPTEPDSLASPKWPKNQRSKVYPYLLVGGGVLGATGLIMELFADEAYKDYKLPTNLEREKDYSKANNLRRLAIIFGGAGAACFAGCAILTLSQYIEDERGKNNPEVSPGNTIYLGRDAQIHIVCHF